MSRPKFAIVGGGIAGLTLAIALQRRGFPVIVYEGAPTIKPLGAGLALAANAVNAFGSIGIRDQVLQAGKVLKTMRIKSELGEILTEIDSEKITAKFGVINNFTIHRADLHQVLARQLEPGTLVVDKRCADWEDRGRSILLKFADGTETGADYIIACDGIHSVVRQKVLPEVKPRYAGYTCWRGITDELPAGADPDETSESWGPGRRFGIVPLTRNRVYWFACLNAKANDPGMKKWGRNELLLEFGRDHFPIRAILENTAEEKIIWNDIIDIRPLKQFAFGRMVLMGDAAHATTPNMGQGACMAIEDAVVLAQCIQEIPSPVEAFKTFEKRRIARTTTIVNKSWNIGKMAQLENRFLIRVRNALVKRTPHSFTEKQIRFLLKGS